MNSTEETLPVSPSNESSSNSLLDASSATAGPTALQELPLLSLTEQQMSAMSEADLRLLVQRLRENRLSAPTFRATLSCDAKAVPDRATLKLLDQLRNEFI